MENPVNTVKKSLSVGKVIGWLSVAFLGFLILDVLGVTDWLLYPYSKAKAQFGKKTAA